MYKVKCIQRSHNNRFALTESKTYIVKHSGMQTDDGVWCSYLDHPGYTPIEKFFNFCEWANKDPNRGELIFELVPDSVEFRRF